MTTKDAWILRLFGWVTALAAIFQVIGLVRYINRLPNDWVGIALYAITLVAFIAISIGSFVQARQKDVK